MRKPLAARIPLTDLRAQYRSIKPDIDRAIQRVLEQGQFVLGPELTALEKEVASFCGTTEAVGVASGTDALELALRSCGIGAGDEVITTAFSFFATAEAIIAVGARPVFVDIEPVTFTLDPALIEARITPRTKAILPVHLYGHPCAMDRILAVARAHQLKVIEDCAQAIGATSGGRRVGTFGEAGCLSFYPSKNLGGYGDGGMVVTNQRSVADQIRLLRVHGSRARYRHLAVGTNSRLDELQAAILRVKLGHLQRWNVARRRVARCYEQAFRRFGVKGIVLPQEQPGCVHVYHLYTIRTTRRVQIQRALSRRGIATQIAYPSTLPSQPALKTWLKRHDRRLPFAGQAAREVLSLPMYPELTDKAIRRVVSCLAQV